MSLSDDISHEFNIVFVKRTVLLELSLQPVRSLKNLFFVTREAYVTRAKRKGNLIVAVICALDTLTNYLQKLLVFLRVSLLLIVWFFVACRTDVIFCVNRGEHEASAKCEWRTRGGALKNPASPHTIVQALPPPGTPFKNQPITALGKLWRETLSGAAKSDHRR